ncbi:MAG: HIT domain-containing protein [Candidatus Hatepunaea meridiana]|nr:HIT domain-containing protein [Candidatus Hatepunaea meridiana]
MGEIDRIAAPWRLEYIQSAVKHPSGCFLCEALDTNDDREKLVIHRDELVFLIMNLYPYNNGHLLVVPNRHIGELKDLTTDELTALGELTRKAVRWMDIAYEPHGYNIGLNLGRVAGAGLPGHLHWHIVPRWDGDTNFMPVLGCVKIISEGLKAGYDRIRQVIEEEGF